MSTPRFAQPATRNPQPVTSYTIPILPHLKKFIEKEYGLPLKPDDHTALGKMITLSLRGRHRNKTGQFISNPTQHLTIPLTSDQRKLNPNTHKLSRLNLHLNTLFKQNMIIWVKAHKTIKVNGKPIKPYTSIKIFRDYYNLTPNEFPIDTAHQHYKRVMKKNKWHFVPNPKSQPTRREKTHRPRPHTPAELRPDNITIF